MKEENFNVIDKKIYKIKQEIKNNNDIYNNLFNDIKICFEKLVKQNEIKFNEIKTNAIVGNLEVLKTNVIVGNLEVNKNSNIINK